MAVIEEFLPRQMSDEELGAAIDAIVAETGAGAMKDMGRVMALVKERHAGQARHGQGQRGREGAALLMARRERDPLPAFLDELRARTTLSALVGRSVKLQRAGQRVQGLLPVPQREDAELLRQ